MTTNLTPQERETLISLTNEYLASEGINNIGTYDKLQQYIKQLKLKRKGWRQIHDRKARHS